MRLVILSDIHGNSIALDAVLASVDRDVDGYLVLGDLCAIGHDPVGVLQRLAELDGVTVIRGNTDRYVVTGELPPDPGEQNKAMIDGFAWTRKKLADAGWLDWLSELPVDHRLTLPDTTRALAVHASPGTDSGDGFSIHQSEEDCARLLHGADADLVLVGHTHVPLDRTVGSVRVFNPGSVGNPPPEERRARFAILEADAAGYRLEWRRADYDRDAVIEAAQASGFPAAGYVAAFLRGEVIFPASPKQNIKSG